MSAKACPEQPLYACPRYKGVTMSKCEDLGVCQRAERADCEDGPHWAGGRNRLPVVTMAGLRSLFGAKVGERQ